MNQKFLFPALMLCGALLAVEPDIYISFNQSMQADFGGKGVTTAAMQNRKKSAAPAGVSARLLKQKGQMAESELLVAGREGKGCIIGKMDDGNIYSLLYQPRPGLDQHAGTISMWVCPENWNGDDGNYHVFYAGSGDGQRLFIYKRPAPQNDICFFYGHAANKIKATTASVSAREWKPGQWHHICVAYDDEEILLFVDGVKCASANVREPYFSPLTEITLGDHWTGDPGKTRVDELRIFDGFRLTEEEMAGEYSRLAK